MVIAPKTTLTADLGWGAIVNCFVSSSGLDDGAASFVFHMIEKDADFEDLAEADNGSIGMLCLSYAWMTLMGKLSLLGGLRIREQARRIHA